MEARDLRQIGRENLAGNWGMSVLAALIAGLLGGLITGSSGSIDIDTELLYELPPFVLRILTVYFSIAGILGIVQFIIGGTIQLGYAQYLLKQHDKQDFQLNDLFSQFGRFGQGFAQSFLRGLFIALWSLLFIIPGIIKSLSYFMTPFIMADNPDMSAKEAIDASKELMNGHKGELFWLGLTFFGWNLLCVLTLGIGTLFLDPYMNASYAAFYRSIGGKRFNRYQELPENQL